MLYTFELYICLIEKKERKKERKKKNKKNKKDKIETFSFNFLSCEEK